jgi:hypothetical protein
MVAEVKNKNAYMNAYRLSLNSSFSIITGVYVCWLYKRLILISSGHVLNTNLMFIVSAAAS